MSSVNSEKLPYTEYQLVLTIGLMSKQTDAVHPKMGRSEEDWNRLTREKQKACLDAQVTSTLIEQIGESSPDISPTSKYCHKLRSLNSITKMSERSQSRSQVVS